MVAGAAAGCDCAPSPFLLPAVGALNVEPRGMVARLPGTKPEDGWLGDKAVVAGNCVGDARPTAGAEPEFEPTAKFETAGRLPVAAAVTAGISNTTAVLPCSEPMDAVRRLTACSLESPSTRLPTLNARGGLPSTEMSATPCGEFDLDGDFGAMIPVSLSRLLSSDTGAATEVAIEASFGVVPNNRATSPTTMLESPTDTA